MARVDKTESAIGVTRGTLAADIAEAKWNIPQGVGIDANGKTVLGAGTTGVVGVIIVDKTNYKAGKRCDIFGNGTEIVELAGFTAGDPVYVVPATGVLTATSTDNVKVGFTVEADRLVVTI